MGKPRVLMVISQYYPVIGGAEKQCMLQAKELIKRGYDVEILTGRWSKQWLKQEHVDSVLVIRVGYFPAVRLLRAVFFYLALFFCLIAKGHTFDIIQVHQALEPSLVVLIANILLKKKCIIKIANSSLRNDIKTIKYSKNIMHKVFKTYRLYNKADFLVAVNRGIIDELSKERIFFSRIAYIPNGIDTSGIRFKDTYEIKDKVLKIVMVGKLAPHKGHEVLLESLADIENVYIELFGRVSNMDKWEEKLKEKDLFERVKTRGIMEHIIALLPRYDIFVLPSYAEGMSNALLEAMACGLPCIATNIPGNVELIGEGLVEKIPDGKFVIKKWGILFNAGDPHGLKAAIMRLKTDVRLRRTLGERSKEKIKSEFDITCIMDQYSKMYESITAR